MASIESERVSSIDTGLSGGQNLQQGTVDMITTNDTILDVLVKEHNTAKISFDNLFSEVNLEKKQHMFNSVVKMLAEHEDTEEEVVHPAVRNMSREANVSIYDTTLSQEAKLKQLLYELDQIGVKHADFDSKARVFLSQLIEHMTYEENQVFPWLQKLSLEDQRKMAGYWLTMKKLVPSRPHPAAPMKPSTGHTLLGPLAAFLDKLRDFGRTFEPAH